MPKRTASPRGRAAADVIVEREQPALLRALLHSPKDTVAIAVAVAAVIGVLVNALILQAGRHPSPFFKSTVAPVAAPAALPMPRFRPADADVKPADPKPAEKIEPRFEPKADTKTDRMALPAMAKPGAPRPPAPIPQANGKADPKADPMRDLINNSGRVAAVQRALTEYGYGQLKPTGIIGPDTSSAISRFERERKLPPTGQLSEKLIRDLSTLTGRPIE